MNIHQLSHNIDQKLAQLELQLAALQQQLTTTESAQLRNDLAALQTLKKKLQASQRIMWQAHELERGGNDKRLREKRWLGIGLCLLSGLGLLGLALIVLTR